MLNLIQSNKMEALEAGLIEQLREALSCHSMTDLFSPVTILVQSPGMAQWLKIRITERLGIAANIDFPLPSSFIWGCYQQHFDDLPEESAFTKNNMTWKLMAVLPGLLELPEFTEIKGYLQSDDGLKRYQLCHKIADVFDQYQVYRPEWILAWEKGEKLTDIPQLEAQSWQPLLWQALVKYTAELQESGYHRGNLHSQLIERISQSNLAANTPLFVFGISALPQQQLDVFQALSRQRPVHVFWCNPSQEYWGDLVDLKNKSRAKVKSLELNIEEELYLQTGNPLLSAWGKLGRDYLEMLLQLDCEIADIFVEARAQTLLGWIQHEIMQLTHRGSHDGLSADELLSNGQAFKKFDIGPTDRSLQIHSCHSKLRELEVLHDYLLHQFATDPELTPGDIIVMMPDVASYAAYIDGVFGGANDGLGIPFAISDRNAVEESPLVGSFIQLMSLHQSRLTLTDILAILEVPAILRRFELSEAEYETIRFWLVDAGVRWGWSGTDKSRWKVPEESANTWLFGLQRMLAGYAVQGQTILSTGSGSIAPLPDVEGQVTLALGKLWQFSQVIEKAVIFCQQSQTISDKVASAYELIEALYQIDEDEQIYLNLVREALDRINHHQSQYGQQISQDIFVREVQQHLQSKGVGQRFLAGSVNFCTLMPMRSIPFKHVCLLGMNDNDYPRQTMPIGFDLISQTAARRGDRSRKVDDRYLFLEAILSARKHFYLSYQGASSKDNSPANPSALVSELLDYCDHVFCLQGDENLSAEQTIENLRAHLIQPHPLQPFNQAYFDGAGQIPGSFQGNWLNVARAMQSKIHPGAFQRRAFVEAPLPSVILASEQRVVELTDVIQMFVNPAKAFFQQRWRTSLAGYQQELSIDEPFSIQGLERYHYTDRLTDTLLRQEDAHEQGIRDFSNRLSLEGALPHGAAGEIALEALVARSQELAVALSQAINGRRQKQVDIDILLPEGQLVGWLAEVYDNDLILSRAGAIRAQHKLVLWLQWLAYCAGRQVSQGQAQFVGIDSIYCIAAVPQDVACRTLNQLIQRYTEGLCAPLYFFPETSFTWVTTQDRNKTAAAFYGSEFATFAEITDANIARVCPDLEAVFAQFAELGEQIIRPILSYEVSP